MNYKLYENIFSDEDIEHIISKIDDSKFHDGMVGGTRVNIKQKKRKDLFINNNVLLSKIDEILYSSLYTDVVSHFCDIKFREKWKVGKYIGNDNAFYNMHRDNSDETRYRKVSMIVALSDPDDYEGGEFCFDTLKEEFKLPKGSVLVFKSSLFHHVNMITSGLRIVLVSFFFDSSGIALRKQYMQSTSPEQYKPILKSITLNYDDISSIMDSIEPLKNYPHDIDYSDKGSKHPWNDNSDHWYEDNNADVLLITFAGMGWKGSIPTFIFHNFLKNYDNIDKLFLRDINCRYYMTGLKNSTSSIEETVDFISKFIENKKYKKIIGLGCSAGGFAAILYGHILKFNKVLAFSPQTVLNHKKTLLIGDKYNAPKTCEWLHTRSKQILTPPSDLYKKSLDLNNLKPFNCNIDVHYSISANMGTDKLHAMYIEDFDKCKIIEHPGNDHMVALTLRNNGQLKEIIEKEFSEEDLS
tara:strand:+ start:2045 stop:3448 length:1404 start_codon:yes stop_codon:yes gene_type:complete